MANRMETRLIEPLYNLLQNERYVLLATIDYENGGPSSSALSWVYAKDEETIFFAVDQRSRIIQNLNANNQAAITMIANESTYSISGNCKIVKEKLEDVPLKLSLVKLDIEQVRDVMFYGSKIATEPSYDKTYDREAAERLDHQVMEALKKA